MKEQTRISEEPGAELKIDAKHLIEEARREGVDISVSSNSISKELAEKIREKYFPKKDDIATRAVKVLKKARTASEAPSVETHMASEMAEFSEVVVIDKEFVHITIPRRQFDLLSAITEQILVETALAQERITKDQGEIDLLKTETREVLKRLRAA